MQDIFHYAVLRNCMLATGLCLWLLLVSTRAFSFGGCLNHEDLHLCLISSFLSLSGQFDLHTTMSVGLGKIFELLSVCVRYV